MSVSRSRVHNLPDREKDKGQQNQGGQHSPSDDCPLCVSPRQAEEDRKYTLDANNCLRWIVCVHIYKGLSRSAHHRSTMLKAIKREMKNKSTSETQGGNGRPSNKLNISETRKEINNAWWASLYKCCSDTILSAKREFVELAHPCKTLEVVVYYNEGSGIAEMGRGFTRGVGNRVVFHLGSRMAFRLRDGRLHPFTVCFLMKRSSDRY